ncbi:hypothetical protein ACG7TL_003133 [Trametes sanguinea]
MFNTARNALSKSRLRVCSALLPVAAAQRPRKVSTVSFDPTIRQFLVKLAEHQPCFNTASSEDLELIDAIRTSLRTNPTLHVYLHLDLNRSTRPGPDSTARILLPLLKEHPERVHVSLFRSPKLKGIMARLVPPRFNEGWGTWHPKVYGADDTVLISGANLNTSYFSNRQDRYLQFVDQPGFAQYCFAFLQAASTFSYRLLPSSSPSEDYTLHWPDTMIHPHRIEAKAEQALTTFQRSQRLASPAPFVPETENRRSAEADNEHDVFIFPVIQAGQFNVREEERCLGLLFRELSAQQWPKPSPASHYDGPLVDLTSGYFALYKPYQQAIVGSHLACRILAASPKANGFFGSRGVSGRIPEAYTLFERRFMSALNEWEREGWTYHAKGIWVRPAPSATPVLTLFGSTNLNSRSANLDTELSFVLATTSPTLRQRLADEVDGLRTHAQLS